MGTVKPESDTKKWNAIATFKGPWPVLGAIIIVIEVLLGFWFYQAVSTIERCIIGVIMLLVLLAVLIVIVRITPINDKKILSREVEFCDNVEHVETKMTNLLNETQECLYYYGGAGFIGDSPIWLKLLDGKLKNEKIKFVRLIDLKSLEEMKEVLKRMKHEDEIKKDVEKYKKFLETHSENLKISGKRNKFYDFEGAPLWKYGIHHLIFDRKHVAIVFLTAGDVKNAIFLRNCPDIAQALGNSIEVIVDIFDLKSTTGDELENISGLR